MGELDRYALGCVEGVTIEATPNTLFVRSAGQVIGSSAQPLRSSVSGQVHAILVGFHHPAICHGHATQDSTGEPITEHTPAECEFSLIFSERFEASAFR